MPRLLLLFLCCLSANIMAAQIVSGNVLDAKTNAPLPGATIYFDGTTLGSISDLDGSFSIRTQTKSSSPLIVSFVGYETVIVEDPYAAAPLTIYLKEASVDLEEVIVTPDKFSRAKKLAAFRLLFLGQQKIETDCRILNEEVLQFYFDQKLNTLHASASEPLIIENTYLGYRIRYNLVEFVAQSRMGSLQANMIKRTIYFGTSFFEDTSGGKRRYKKRRKAAYEGSALQLMRILTDQEIDERQEFKFYVKTRFVEKELLVDYVKYGTYYKLRFKSHFRVRHKDQISLLQPAADYLVVDGFGNFLPTEGLIFSGHIANQRVAVLLPMDYGM
ncbi:MAG: carboxypeptidase-like regulatory domain-containing protein [Bacteroidota bacterium]